MDYRSLYTAYRANPQEPETSREVVRFWHNPQVRYKDEEFSLEARECCLRRVAERIVHRRILGLDGLETEHAKKAFRVEVFGKGSPLLSELLLPDVFVAMAFVPLTPGESSTSKLPRLARLYCVSGLGGQKRLPFLEGTNEPVLDKYSWFIEGISDRERISGVEGRSWLLAAHILSKIVGRKDKKTACNLAKHYIVTGDVQGGGNICKVEMGRKEELASQKWFANFKWIIPKENDMNIPKRKIEKPETLEEAYKLIESMRNTATKSFFRFLREGNLDGVEEQYKIGADIYGREEKTDLTCLEVVAEEKAKLFTPAKKNKDGSFVPESVELEKYKQSVRESIGVYSKIDRWLRINGADAATMFYLLAKNEDEEGIIRNREKYSINACDEKGHTAVDIALIKSEYKVAKLLNKCGGVINSRWRANARIVRCVDNVCMWYEDLSKEECEFLANAMEMGLSPDIGVSLEYDDHGCEVSQSEIKYCTLFGAAIETAKYNVVEACLQNGIDVNKEVRWRRIEYFGFGEYEEVIDKKGTPWDILSKHKGVNDELRCRFKGLFLRYGARIPSEA
jgi:hypothetical protein